MESIDVDAVLDYDISRPREAADGSPVAVLLHGRGSDKTDLQGLGRLVPDDWTLITPRAPYAGAAWGYGAGWAWYRYLRENEVVRETLEQSLLALDTFLATLPDMIGGEPGPIVLGGFSQGGTTSLAYALSRPGSVTAVLNFSGFLEASVDLSSGAEAPPIFWGHGLLDPAIPHRLAVSGRSRLVDAGLRLTARDYAIGHWIVPEEVDEAVEMVRQSITQDTSQRSGTSPA